MLNQVTYSSAYTLVPTYECFNRCSYCNFRADPGNSPWLSMADATEKLKSLQGSGVVEILILSGEVHPQSKRRSAWFEHIYNLCQLALDLGFLPHTNIGPLSWQEMAQMRQVNVSMGLMLEQVTPQLLTTVHRQAPSKVPQLRLQQLAWAGELRIPFTTGLLLGIGEKEGDWCDTLVAIANIHQRWGHIQEVILQPHSLGSQQSESLHSFNPYRLPEVITLARQILPGEIAIQIPPNLVSEPQFLLNCLQAGARDLGGISPKDEVNPDYPHPTKESLTAIIEPAGWKLQPRLPVHTQYYSWLPAQLQSAMESLNFK